MLMEHRLPTAELLGMSYTNHGRLTPRKLLWEYYLCIRRACKAEPLLCGYGWHLLHGVINTSAVGLTIFWEAFDSLGVGLDHLEA